MFCGETKLDDRDLFLQSQIGKWIVLNWRADLFPPPLGKPYGTHLATFVVCPHGAEIRGLNMAWLYTDSNKRIYPVGKTLEGIESTWLFKYSTLKQFEMCSLPLETVDFLQLPDIDSNMHNNLSVDVKELRADQRLNAFRHPGYPDDVAAVCGPDFELPQTSIGVKGEQVWMRLEKQLKENCFQGELLNQPSFYHRKKGQKIEVHLIQSILACGRPIEPSD
jgi:hypothetical protein